MIGVLFLYFLILLTNYVHIYYVLHTAFMKGMLKIKGKMNLAMKLTAVLNATRKKLPKSKL